MLKLQLQYMKEIDKLRKHHNEFIIATNLKYGII